MSADAYKIDSENAIILKVNSGAAPAIIMDDEVAVLRGGATGSNIGYIEANQNGLKIGATVYGTSRSSTYTATWRYIDGVWLLAAQ